MLYHLERLLYEDRHEEKCFEEAGVAQVLQQAQSGIQYLVRLFLAPRFTGEDEDVGVRVCLQELQNCNIRKHEDLGNREQKKEVFENSEGLQGLEGLPQEEVVLFPFECCYRPHA